MIINDLPYQLRMWPLLRDRRWIASMGDAHPAREHAPSQRLDEGQHGADLSGPQAIVDWLRSGASSARDRVPSGPPAHARYHLRTSTRRHRRDAIGALRIRARPIALNPVLPIDVSVDHSIAVDHYGVPEALRLNMTRRSSVTQSATDC